MPKVLLIDAEMTMVQMVGELLRAEGHHVIPFTNPASALEALGTHAPELVIANLSPDKTRTSGLGILQQARRLNPPALVLMITAPDGSGSAIEAMKHGAYDYLHKPFTPEELRLRVRRALAYNAAVIENASLRKQVQAPDHFQQIIGLSDKMQAVLKQVERLANSDSSILVSGPPGVGKELVARVIHFHSRRRFGPFIRVGCRSVPEHLLEIDLFGERKSQFGISTEDTPGLVNEASGGTLFLREIEAVSGALQERLLRVLQGQEYHRPGQKGAEVDVRIFASTCHPQPSEATGGPLRDFLQQLSPVSLVLPALRDRLEDIPLLIAHYLNGRVQPGQAKAYGICREAIELCAAHRWPGNVRELELALEHACARAREGMIQVEDLPRTVQPTSSDLERRAAPQTESLLSLSLQNAARVRPLDASNESGPTPFPSFSEELVPLKKFLRDQEVAYLQRILVQVGGSKEKAAELLGISLATIYRKLSEPESPESALPPPPLAAAEVRPVMPVI